MRPVSRRRADRGKRSYRWKSIFKEWRSAATPFSLAETAHPEQLLAKYFRGPGRPDAAAHPPARRRAGEAYPPAAREPARAPAGDRVSDSPELSALVRVFPSLNQPRAPRGDLPHRHGARPRAPSPSRPRCWRTTPGTSRPARPSTAEPRWPPPLNSCTSMAARVHQKAAAARRSSSSPSSAGAGAPAAPRRDPPEAAEREHFLGSPTVRRRRHRCRPHRGRPHRLRTANAASTAPRTANLRSRRRTGSASRSTGRPRARRRGILRSWPPATTSWCGRASTRSCAATGTRSPRSWTRACEWLWYEPGDWDCHDRRKVLATLFERQREGVVTGLERRRRRRRARVRRGHRPAARGVGAAGRAGVHGRHRPRRADRAHAGLPQPRRRARRRRAAARADAEATAGRAGRRPAAAATRTRRWRAR